jgi:hypothetical protein
MNANRVLQVLMGLVALAHLAVGVALNLGGQEMLESVADLYGAKVETWSPEFLYIVKPLGAFMFALGVIGAVAAFKPRKHLLVIYGFCILFFIRALQRLMFGQDLLDTFGIGSARNVVNAVFFAAYAVLMIVYARKVSGTTPKAST